MKSKRRMEQVLCYVVPILPALMALVPVLWVISTAFKTETRTYSSKPQWISDPAGLESFHKLFTAYNFGRMTLNSLIACIFAMIICITCACLADYGMIKFQFRDKKQLADFLLMTQMFPSVMLVVPFCVVLSKYHMTDKLTGLIIVYVTTNVTFNTWMLVSYFKTVSIESGEAVGVDGASSFRIFWGIILLLIVSGIAAVVVFVLFNEQDEYMYPSILIPNDQLKTLTVGIISPSSQYQIKWNNLMATSTVSNLPLVVLFMCSQKYFIADMIGGVVKS